MNEYLIAGLFLGLLTLVIRWGLRYVDRHQDDATDDSAGWP